MFGQSGTLESRLVTSAPCRDCVKTPRKRARKIIDPPERAVFDFLGVRKGQDTPKIKLILRFYTAFAQTGQSRTPPNDDFL